jgi:DNA-binding IclR family transcriptional regulator
MEGNGTQVLRRGVLLLRLLSQSNDGLRSSELCQRSGLPRPTVHRLLSTLRLEGFVELDEPTRRWRLGPEIFLIGMVARRQLPFDQVVRPILRSLATSTGESVCFSVRSGDETICVLREEGSFPIRSFELAEGKRFPLGVATAGLAILAFCSPEEQERICAEQLYGDGSSAERSVDDDRLHRMLAATLETGYSVIPGLIVEGSWGVGAPVFDKSGRPAAALSINGVEARIAGDRQVALGQQLLKGAHLVSKRLVELSW